MTNENALGTPTLWLDINASSFVDINNVPVNLGLPADPGAANRSLASKGAPNHDVWAYNKVAIEGIGDITLSEDETKMYIMDLTNRQLLIVDIATKKLISKVVVPDPGCSGGSNDRRPWAVKAYNGDVFIGLVCSGETNRNKNDLNAFVMKLDNPNNPTTFVTVITTSGIPQGKTYVDWKFWSNNENDINSSVDSWTSPLMSDLEFDINGNMIVGLMDRSGHQHGSHNYPPTTSGTYTYVWYTFGDILKATKTTTGWSFDNDYGTFYKHNSGKDGTEETFIGGIISTNCSGTDLAIAQVQDPLDFESNGTVWLKNSDGDRQTGVANTSMLEIVSGWSSGVNLNFGKANGLGDLEILNVPAKIEIGNRVFMDTDSDGEQDPNEMGLDGIKVELWKAGAKVSDVTTTNSGQWFFTNLDVATAYEVKILSADIPSGKSLTTSNTASNAKDLIDNDAILSGTDAVITYTTGNAGENNHTLDFGFRIACTLTATGIGTNPTCANNDGAIDLTVTGAASTPSFIWSNNSLSEDLTGLSAGEYKVTVTDGDGTCYAKASVTIEVIPTNIQQQICVGETYKLEIQDATLTGIQWKKDGLDISGANGLTYDATQVGVYTYSSNGVGGCAVGQCCPIELTLNPSCCKPKVCTTVKITRK